MDVEELIDELIEREGDYANHPADRCGPTRFGITEAVARAHGYRGSIAALPREEAEAIYRRLYWLRPRFDAVAERAPAVAAELFDTGANMGPAVAATCLLHRPERGNHHRHSALVVPGARADPVIALPLPALERAVWFEHRVEVADQQHPLALAVPLVRRDDMTGPAGRLHVDPLHFEAQRFQLGPEHLANPGHALDIERAAILVDPFLEHGKRPLLLRIDGLDHPGFRRRKLGDGGTGGKCERGKRECGGTEHGARLAARQMSSSASAKIAFASDRNRPISGIRKRPSGHSGVAADLPSSPKSPSITCPMVAAILPR